MVGTPYELHGRRRGALDCCGFIRAVRMEVFGNDEDFDAYEENKLSARVVIRNARRYLQSIRPEVAEPGDIVVLALRREATHLAIITDSGIIHADVRLGVVEVPVPDDPQLNWATVYLRFPEVVEWVATAEQSERSSVES